jgi:hypothetical protein
MDINYPLWSKNAPASGKVLKIIFKATNCRDYDARILSCKKDKRIVQEDNIPQSFYIETGSTLTYADNLSFNKEE